MQNTSFIKSTKAFNALGICESINHEWVGDSPYVYVSIDFLDDVFGRNSDKASIKIGPYELLKVDSFFHINSILYVRKKDFGSLRVALYKLSRLLDLIYRRTIITLAVWNIADYSEARLPTWRDIRILKKLTK